MTISELRTFPYTSALRNTEYPYTYCDYYKNKKAVRWTNCL